MSDGRAVYVVGPPDAWRAGMMERLRPHRPVERESVASFRSERVGAHGVVLLGPDVPEEEAAAVAEGLARQGSGWTVLRAEAGEGDRVRAVGPPCSLDLQHVLERLGAGGPALSLSEVLRFIAVKRHDINNPLTSVMAETQLLLMDVEDPDVREALETIQEQVRRIRDLVADLAALPRPPA